MTDARHHGRHHGTKHHGQHASQPRHAHGDLLPTDDRRGGRFLMGGAVTCNLGRLINLSVHGALVQTRTPFASNVPFVVTDGACRVACNARVVRTRRMGEHRHSCALQFDALRPEEEAALEHIIARHHMQGGETHYREAA